MRKLFRPVSVGISVAALTTFLATASFASAASASATGPKPRALSALCGYTGSQPTLAQGSVDTSAHSPVKQAQCELNWAYALSGNRNDPLTVDGIFGPRTAQETREFQSCVHIAVDGIIGPDTWSELNFWVNQPTFACG